MGDAGFVFYILGGITALLWVGFRFVAWVFARVSGWHRLAGRYAATPPGPWQWPRQSVQVGPIRFRRIAQLSPQPDALFLMVGAILWLPPIRIPWSDFGPPRAAAFYGKPSVAVPIGNPPVTEIQFPLPLWEAMRPFRRA